MALFAGVGGGVLGLRPGLVGSRVDDGKMKQNTKRPHRYKPVAVPESLASCIEARLSQHDAQAQAVNAYIQGIADTLDVPPGWKFDRAGLEFRPPEPPAKGDA